MMNLFRVSSTSCSTSNDNYGDTNKSNIENNIKMTQATPSKHLDNLVLNTNKAGMGELDTAKINEIIQKTSEGSLFYQHKKQAQQKLDAKIADMMHLSRTFTPDQLRRATTEMELVAQQLGDARDLSRIIVHVDMDMFYAAVEMRDDPALSSIPMAVGCSSMLSTSNYAARKFGVRAAMPGFIGMKLCPQLVIVPPNFSKYRAVSEEVQRVFQVYDENFVMMSLDEAYLDLTEYVAAREEDHQELDGTGSEQETDSEKSTPSKTLAEVVVEEMRQKIYEATQLTASAGIAPNTRLAKVCSDLNKPNGQYYLPPNADAIMDFINTLPIRKISGIGGVMEQQLRALGVQKCGDLESKYGLLRLLFSDTCHSYFVRISLGLGETDLSNMGSSERKSISTETTFAGTDNRQQLLELLSGLCRDLHEDMCKKELLGKVITVKVKTVEFVLRTRSLCLGEATQDLEVMLSISRKLLLQEMERGQAKKPLALRLLGVRMSSLTAVTAGGSLKQMTINKLFARIGNKDSDVDTTSITDTEENGGKAQSKRDTKVDAETNANLPMFHSEKNRYICPICNNWIKTKFLSIFNKHIDACLEKSSEFGSEILERASYQTSNNAIELTPSTHDNNFSLTSQTGSAKFCQSSSSESERLLSAEEVTTLQCPVCCRAQFDSHEALNIHLDDCLTLQEVDTLTINHSNSLGVQVKDSHCVSSTSAVVAAATEVQNKSKRKLTVLSKSNKKLKTRENTITKYFS